MSFIGLVDEYEVALRLPLAGLTDAGALLTWVGPRFGPDEVDERNR